MSQALTPLEAVKQTIHSPRMERELRAALPDHIPVKRFQQVVITAVSKTPGLVEADRQSLFLACVECAQDGLLPNGKEAALVIYNTKDKKHGNWTQQVRYMPMIAGVYAKAHRGGEIKMLVAHLVYENDEFDYELGFEPRITHKPAVADRGTAIGAYALAVLANGIREIEYMSREEIEDVRGASKAGQDGPWVEWWGEMARKTVVRRLCKRLPLSADMERVVTRDDDMYELDATPAAPALVHDDDTDVALLDRAADIADREGIPTDEALARAKEEQEAEAEPEEPSDELAEVIDSGKGLGEPGLIPVPAIDDEAEKWRAWGRLVKEAVAAAPDREWLQKFRVANETPMARIREFSPKWADALDALIENRFAELGDAT